MPPGGKIGKIVFGQRLHVKRNGRRGIANTTTVRHHPPSTIRRASGNLRHDVVNISRGQTVVEQAVAII